MTQISTFKPLEERIGFAFEDNNLLKQAFIHRSYLNEHQNEGLNSNEKLEFLGDSVLSLITSVYLFQHYPQFNEGEYTDIKAAIVRTESLAEAARNLNLGEYLLLSKGEKENKGHEQKSLLADCFEAFLAAIFIEKGFRVARAFVEEVLFKNTLDDIIRNKRYMPAKNLLQEYYQGKYKVLPVYKIESEQGPQHKKIYTVGVYGEKRLLGKGVGNSKKEAEEAAASSALKSIHT